MNHNHFIVHSLRALKRESHGSSGELCRSFRVLFLSAAVLCLVFMVLIIPSSSWEADNRDVYYTGSGVLSEQIGPVLTPYTVFQRSGQTVSTIQISDQLQPASRQNAALLQLSPYDAILGENQDTAVFFRIPVYGVSSGDSFTLSVTCNGSLNAQGNHVGAQDGVNLLMDSYLSNLVGISCGVIPLSTIPSDATPETVYQSAAAFFSAVTPQSFVSMSGSTIVRKDSQISFQVSGFTPENGMIYVYLKLDYRYELVDAYLTALRRSQPSANRSDSISFSGLVSSAEPIVYDLGQILLTTASSP